MFEQATVCTSLHSRLTTQSLTKKAQYNSRAGVVKGLKWKPGNGKRHSSNTQYTVLRSKFGLESQVVLGTIVYGSSIEVT